MPEHVVLVNENDEELGIEEKLFAHEQGLLHRAFSLLLFNDAGEMLLQKRARAKYHSPGLWSNACCSHPRHGESVEAAVHRRLYEELRIDCPIQKAFSFVYRADVGGGLIEHEFDHLFTSVYNGPVDAFNPDEVEECRWISPRALEQEIAEEPTRFTPWFLIIRQRTHCLG